MYTVIYTTTILKKFNTCSGVRDVCTYTCIAYMEIKNCLEKYFDFLKKKIRKHPRKKRVHRSTLMYLLTYYTLTSLFDEACGKNTHLRRRRLHRRRNSSIIFTGTPTKIYKSRVTASTLSYTHQSRTSSHTDKCACDTLIYIHSGGDRAHISSKHQNARQPTESRHQHVFARRRDIVPLRHLRYFRFRRSRSGATAAATTRGHRVRRIRDAIVVGNGRLFRRIARTGPRVPQDQSGDRPGPGLDQAHHGHHRRRGAVHPGQRFRARNRTATGRGGRPSRPGRRQGLGP